MPPPHPSTYTQVKAENARLLEHIEAFRSKFNTCCRDFVSLVDSGGRPQPHTVLAPCPAGGGQGAAGELPGLSLLQA